MDQAQVFPHSTSPANPYGSQQRSPSSGEMQPWHDMVTYAQTYAREHPEVAALWCFGLGFVLGWKLKPW